MADEESYLDKIGAAINKYTGGDYMSRTRERARKKLEQAAPGSTEAIDKASWALEQTPMIGMARARALKDVKKAADTAKKMRGAKGGSKVIETAKDASGVYVPKSGPKARGRASQGSPGTSYSKKSLESTRTRQRTEKEANKFGPLVKREEKVPAVQKRGLPAVVKEENRGIVPYKRPGELARYDDRSRQVRTFGDKAAHADKGRIVGLSRMGKVAVGGAGAGLGALGYALAPDAKKAGASGSSASGDSKIYGGARQGESTRGYGKGRAPVPKAKPDNKSDRKAAPKAAGDKSRVAKKMTNFERMKARQYEKEGYGGRSLTAEGARAQVARERGYKVSDLFKRKSSGSKPSGKSFDGRFKSDAAKRFANLRQGR